MSQYSNHVGPNGVHAGAVHGTPDVIEEVDGQVWEGVREPLATRWRRSARSLWDAWAALETTHETKVEREDRKVRIVAVHRRTK